MKIKLIVVGKTDKEYLRTGFHEYESRVKKYLPFEYIEIPALKSSQNLSHEECNRLEAEKIRSCISVGDTLILLDERGKEMRSVEFADFLNKRFQAGGKNLVFVVGGPFGFDEKLKKEAQFLISLSKMTFSHQMVRLFFAEQLYRALSILRNEPYHHE
ncbi:MAG: 23S rRNA (pseudouridine(1915)-N(3))-methyltransferase RlmH [Bacteroidota bacterium]|nr:23S rRNA (pseudouridine(1915)-N(3))-methyltransferase RlmH [Bacteroidota bacterium]